MKTQILSLLFLLTLASQTTTRAGVLPPDAVVGDKTIAEWSAEWWKWVFYIPTNQNPLTDTDGSKAHVGQPDGPVFFLAGRFGFSSTATRRFTVPEGKYLFFPILNAYAGDPGDPPTVEERRETLRAYIALTTILYTTIDGVEVPNLSAYRVFSPVFSIDLPSCDNIMTINNGFCISGLQDNMVSDGFWLMLEPLPPGAHVINFGGTHGPPINFTIDIADTITVVPVPLEQRVEELLAKVVSAPLPSKSLRPLLARLESARASLAKGKVKAGVHHLREFQSQVQAQVAKLDATMAEEWIQAAQIILDRILRPPVGQDLPRVLPPDAVVDGQSIGEWAVHWYRSFYALGTNVSPMFDPDGRSAANGQPEGAVFFLGSGTGFETAPIHRTFSVPEGKYLLVPLLVATVDYIDTQPPLPTIDEMREGLASFLDDPRDLHASIDGVEVSNLLHHRAATPVFSVEYPDSDNYLSVVYGHPIVGLVDPVLGDGYWLMIEPLAPGQHVLRYGGAYRLPFYFPTDITASITVVPVPLEQRVEDLIAKVEAAGLPSKRIRPLLAMLKVAGASFARGKVKSGVHHLRGFQHQVREKVAKLDETTAEEFIQAAQEIIERANGGSKKVRSKKKSLP